MRSKRPSPHLPTQLCSGASTWFSETTFYATVFALYCIGSTLHNNHQWLVCTMDMALCNCGNRLRSHSLTQLWCLTLLSLRLDWRELELHFWLYILRALIPEWNQTKMIYRVSARMRVLVRVCIISLVLVLRASLSPFVVVVCSILVLSVLAGTSHFASHSPPWLTQFLCRAALSSLLSGFGLWRSRDLLEGWGDEELRTEKRAHQDANFEVGLAT